MAKSNALEIFTDFSSFDCAEIISSLESEMEKIYSEVSRENQEQCEKACSSYLESEVNNLMDRLKQMKDIDHIEKLISEF